MLKTEALVVANRITGIGVAGFFDHVTEAVAFAEEMGYPAWWVASVSPGVGEIRIEKLDIDLSI